jgi:hypothetical protein
LSSRMSPAKPFRRCPVLLGEVTLDDTRTLLQRRAENSEGQVGVD